MKTYEFTTVKNPFGELLDPALTAFGRRNISRRFTNAHTRAVLPRIFDPYCKENSEQYLLRKCGGAVL
jgi:hypothetical protein